MTEWLERRACNLKAPLSPLAEFVHGSPEFKSPTMLVNSQLVCLRPVGILNRVKFDLNHLFQTFPALVR